jgi:outer membrane beta-barrel protein
MTTSSRNKSVALFVASAAAILVTASARPAQAQRVSPLADAPAIRKRVELRDKRFEAGVGFGSTVGQDYFHSMFLNLKLDFHINDWLSIGGTLGLGVANLETAYEEKLVGSLGNMPAVPREPSAAEAQASMEKIGMMLAAQAEFTPFTGKFGLFGKVFAHYDFYFFGGFGALSVKPSGTTTACGGSTMGATDNCGVSGLKPGGTFGFGAHAFIKQWLALNLELRDIMAKINPSGRDVNGDGLATNADINWGHTYIVGLNLVAFLPSTAVISQ